MSRMRSLGMTLMLLGAAVGVSACGGSTGAAGNSGNGSKAPQTATVVEAGAPDSLDPQVGQTLASGEATWNAYLGLYTYAHANGTAGTKVIPALATSYPKVTEGGTLYSMTLRKGLTYSNGAPVKASDFTHAIERAIKLNWGGKGFFLEYIAGAVAYEEGKAPDVSGITTDDKSGQITIKLSSPYGPFLNILAFPAAGLVPASTPMKAQPNDPPPGVGPYVIANVKPGNSFEETINPHWASEAIPGVPTPNMNVLVKVQSNPGAEADEVLEGSADLFDWNTPLPPSAAQQAKREAAGRYQVLPTATVNFFFLDTAKAPFNNLLAREAVQSALNRPAYARLASGYMQPGCYLLPPQIVGHPSAPCPYGSATASGNLAKARELVKRSGTAGQAVTVWGESASPYKEFVETFTQMLNAIGYKATEKIISPAAYFPTITNLKTEAQAGFAGFSEDFPNPVDFYQLLDSHSIQPEGNHDLSLVRDPKIDSEVQALSGVPSSQLESVAGRWEALERHTATQAYMAVIGYQEAPKLTSSRIDFNALVFSPVYGPDWTTLKLK